MRDALKALREEFSKPAHGPGYCWKPSDEVLELTKLARTNNRSWCNVWEKLREAGVVTVARSTFTAAMRGAGVV